MGNRKAPWTQHTSNWSAAVWYTNPGPHCEPGSRGRAPEVLSKRPVIGSCVSRLERGRPGQIVHHPGKVRATGWKHCPRVLQI